MAADRDKNDTYPPEVELFYPDASLVSLPSVEHRELRTNGASIILQLTFYAPLACSCRMMIRRFTRLLAQLYSVYSAGRFSHTSRCICLGVSNAKVN